MLTAMMSSPTAIISGRVGSLLTMYPPIGAATTPPMIRPIAELNSDQPSVRIKVAEITSVTKTR